MTINKTSSIYFIGFFTLVIFGFILALNYVNEHLKDKISQAKTAELNTILTTHMPCQNFSKSTIEKQEFYYCSKTNIIAIHGFSEGYMDKIEYLALFDITTNFIKHIEIINHKETPGLGDKLTNPQWLATIYNKVKNEVEIKLNGGKVDSFTAATITPLRFLRHLRQDITWLTNNNDTIKTITQR